jgi:hypothetical protein
MGNWFENLKVLRRAVETLEKSIYSFHDKLGNPNFIREQGKERFEYASPTSLHFQFLKGIVIVSGLNTIMHLLEGGYTHEIGVLVRTLYDSIDEIEYVQEVHETGKMTKGQKKIVDDFFASSLKTAEELLKNPDKRSRVTKKEIRASLARILGKFSNPDRVQRLYQVTHSIYSGYVHGNYPHIMELCNGFTNIYGNTKTQFRLRGSLDTPFMGDYQDVFAGLVHRSLNTFGTLALNFELPELKNEIIIIRKEIESKDIYDPRPK